MAAGLQLMFMFLKSKVVEFLIPCFRVQIIPVASTII